MKVQAAVLNLVVRADLIEKLRTKPTLQKETELAKWLFGKRHWLGQLITSFKAQGRANTKGYTVCLRNSSGAMWLDVRN